MQYIYAHGYCRWKPIETRDMEIEFARDDDRTYIPRRCRMDAVDMLAGICFDTGCHGCCPIGSEVTVERRMAGG
jgi:hypothetical protein